MKALTRSVHVLAVALVLTAAPVFVRAATVTGTNPILDGTGGQFYIPVKPSTSGTLGDGGTVGLTVDTTTLSGVGDSGSGFVSFELYFDCTAALGALDVNPATAMLLFTFDDLDFKTVHLAGRVLFNETMTIDYRQDAGGTNTGTQLMIDGANYDSPQFGGDNSGFDTDNETITYEILLSDLGLSNADWAELNAGPVKDFALWMTFTSNRLHTFIGDTKVQNVPEDVHNSFEFVGVPEPATLALLGIGSLALLFSAGESRT